MSMEQSVNREVDAVIVGAGPTGSLVAAKLAAAGLSVVVLESGDRFKGHNALENTEANAGKIMWHEPRNHVGGDFVIPKTGVGVGGGTLSWLGVMPRFHQADFCTHTTEGVGADWPISYDDLRPHYETVEREFGVAGESGPFAPEPYTLPMPAHRMNWHAQVLARGAKKLGAQPFAPPIAINSVARDQRRAFPAWKRFSPHERGRMLNRIAALIEKHEDELAELITLENGKPLWEARKEVATAVSWTEYYAGWTTKLTGETIPMSIPGQFLNYTTREPLGVVAGITPPNYPLTMVLYKAIPAIATGNTIVIKPSEDTSLVALRLGEIICEAEIPDGVFNIVTGLGETVGATLANHHDVDKITFTGSTEVGRLLVHASAGNLKKVSLELGGKSPNIVFADADLEAALKGVFFGIFFCQGEICSAGSRLFVERSIYEEFVARVSDMARSVKLGHGLDEQTKMGPLVSRGQQQRVLNYIRIGTEENAKPVAGGIAPDGELADGFFVQPTVFSSVSNSMRIAQEEIFGPVVCAIPFDDLPDAIAKGNDSPFGLAAGVWTRDVRKAHQAAAALDAGTVWVNCFNAFDNASPWGGFKLSGWGREKGPYGLDLFTQVKSVIVNYS
jgi:acyl-CoA reductase-like NAD-dependent aldehyde dehydrogenase